MHLHFIAIGGSIMHGLALALHHSGYTVTGSDDAIHEPARSRLANAGLLPQENGWFPERLRPRPDAVVLGMHAKQDNPELEEAKMQGIPIYSFPSFLAYLLNDKTQVVVAGSHGKTTITSMVMHILGHQGWQFDHLVGAQVQGFQNPVRIDQGSSLAILEGDEYPSSCLDPHPKFYHYKPSILLLSGIAWDHINAFPTFDSYLSAFRGLLKRLEPFSKVIYDQDDPYLPELLAPFESHLHCIPYQMPEWFIDKNQLNVKGESTTYAMPFAGAHNLKNMVGACQIAYQLGIPKDECLSKMQSFYGADKRLQQYAATNNEALFRDFAHAPSKVKATINGLKAQFPERRLIAILELHTYSSLSAEFLPQYSNSLKNADEAVIFINPESLHAKGSQNLSKSEIAHAFGTINTSQVCFSTIELQQYLSSVNLKNSNVVVMSSGNFQGDDLLTGLEHRLLN